MEIRNALQKIENYLTVVSNLNKTILSEGTMSRDELLLMKKYLYTSIDRIEDIERMLVIEATENKLFTPTQPEIQEKRPSVEQEITTIEENSNIEEIGTLLSENQKEEIEKVIEEIQEEEPETNITKIENEIIAEDAINTPNLSIEEVINKDELKLDDNTTEYKEEVVAEKEEAVSVITSVVDKFEDIQPVSFVEKIEEDKKEETLFVEHLEQQLNTTAQKPLFQQFDDGKEELHETLFRNEPALMPNINGVTIENKTTNLVQETVLVTEKDVDTIVENRIATSLNDVFKPVEEKNMFNSTTEYKSLSQLIALNDKFIFVRELFGNQFNEYEQNLKALDVLTSFDEIQQFCQNNLWHKFNWEEKSTIVNRFFEVVQKKFS